MRALLDYFGSVEIAWQAPVDALSSAGLGQKIIENLVRIRQDVNLEGLLTGIQKQGIQVITWDDPIYPRRLKDIDQPPPVLYMRGTIKMEDEWSVSIVGTRRATAYGRQIAEELAAYLSRNGITVVSGLARGIDSFAHQATIRAGGRTLAVLGSGVDRIYPPEHVRLAEEIVENGALLSDYPLGTPPDSINFPPRNRIISGLSLATVVVEAGETSGAIITATFAVEQGRDVFAVPGNIHAVQSKGTNNLIQQGARPLLKFEDVLEVLHLQQVQEHREARRQFPMDKIEATIMHILGPEPLHIDEIGAQSGLPINKVSATLALMELKGMVYQVGGMSYIAARESRLEYGRGSNG